MIILQVMVAFISAICFAGAINGAFILRKTKNKTDFRSNLIAMCMLLTVGIWCALILRSTL